MHQSFQGGPQRLRLCCTLGVQSQLVLPVASKPNILKRKALANSNSWLPDWLFLLLPPYCQEKCNTRDGYHYRVGNETYETIHCLKSPTNQTLVQGAASSAAAQEMLRMASAARRAPRDLGRSDWAGTLPNLEVARFRISIPACLPKKKE